MVAPSAGCKNISMFVFSLVWMKRREKAFNIFALFSLQTVDFKFKTSPAAPSISLGKQIINSVY